MTKKENLELIKINAPRALPNNLDTIKKIRNYDNEQLADVLGVGLGYLKDVIREERTFSGKKTIEALLALDTSFAVLYDVQKTMELETVDWYIRDKEMDLKVTGAEDSKKETKIIRDSIKKTLEDNEKYRRTNKITTIQENEEEKSKLFLVEYTTIVEDNKIKEFEIDFSKDNNKYLIKKLSKRGFIQTARRKKYFLDRENSPATIDEKTNEIIFKEPIIIPDREDSYNGQELNRLNVDDHRINFNKDKTYFTVPEITPELNCLDYIEELYNLREKKVAEALALSHQNYKNLKIGHQKISSFTMWKLVQLLRVPLELFINVPEYYKFLTEEN